MAPNDLLYIAAVTAFLFWTSEIVILDTQNTYFGYPE